MADISQIDKLKNDIRLDNSRKANLNEELTRLKRNLATIEEQISNNNKDLITIEELEKNIGNAADGILDAIKDMQSYFQGNLANNIVKEYGNAEQEVTEVYNKIVDEYNRILKENEYLKRQHTKTLEDIIDIEHRIGLIDKSIENTNKTLKNLETQSL